MKPWKAERREVTMAPQPAIDREEVRNPFEALKPEAAPAPAIILQCLYGPHKAEVLHRGTAYCRECYDKRNPFGQLIDS